MRQIKSSGNKRGDILIENVLFIILNLIFLTILVLFLWKQATSEKILEETYSKQIALILDSSKPIMEIKMNLNDLKEVSDENKFDFSRVVSINGNAVQIKLTEKGGYEYSFFTNVNVRAYAERNSQNEYTGNYIFEINKK